MSKEQRIIVNMHKFSYLIYYRISILGKNEEIIYEKCNNRISVLLYV
jgi:hypothetical protein